MPTTTRPAVSASTVVLLALLFATGGRSAPAGAEKIEVPGSDVPVMSEYGSSIAFVDDLFVVGSPGSTVDGVSDRGAVYVFLRDWYTGGTVQVAKLTSSDQVLSGSSLNFGLRVATDGQRILVMAATNARAWIYRRADASASSWVLEDVIAGTAFEDFGRSGAIQGDIAVIGSPEDNGPSEFNSNTGAVFIYQRWSEDNTWPLSATHRDTTLWTSARFGRSVALSADTTRIVVGVPGLDHVTVIDRSAGGAWSTPRAKFNVEPMSTGGLLPEYGFSVAITGRDRIAVGARLSNQHEISAGELYIHDAADSSSWNETAVLGASDAADGDQLGRWTSIDGDVAVATTPGRNDAAGAIYVFRRSNGFWSETDILELDTAAQQRLGSSVVLHDDLIFAGARTHGPSSTGSAFLWSLNGCPAGQENRGGECVSCPGNTQSLLGSPCSCPNGEFLPVTAAACVACAGTDTSIPGHDVSGCVCADGQRNDGSTGCVSGLTSLQLGLFIGGGVLVITAAAMVLLRASKSSTPASIASAKQAGTAAEPNAAARRKKKNSSRPGSRSRSRSRNNTAQAAAVSIGDSRGAYTKSMTLDNV